MAIKLELFGENIEAFKRELETLAELVRPVVQATAAPVTVSLADAIKGVSFQELHELVVAHFDREGYEVVIIEREPKPPLTAVEAETIVKEPARAKGRPRLATVETAVKKLKGNGGDIDKPGPPTLLPEEDLQASIVRQSEADRRFVLDTLGKWVKDPARKAEVLAFAAKVAQAHGATKIVDLPPPPFPAIRREMEKAFDHA